MYDPPGACNRTFGLRGHLKSMYPAFLLSAWLRASTGFRVPIEAFYRLGSEEPVSLVSLHSLRIVAAPRPRLPRTPCVGERPHPLAGNPTYSRPSPSTDHEIRASLSASAMVATGLCVLLSRSSNQMPIRCRDRPPFGLKHRAPWMSRRRRDVAPRFVMPPSRILPPVDICLGTSPSHGAASLPRENADPSGTEAIMAVATSGPTLGKAISGLQAAISPARRSRSRVSVFTEQSVARHSS